MAKVLRFIQFSALFGALYACLTGQVPPVIADFASATEAWIRAHVAYPIGAAFIVGILTMLFLYWLLHISDLKFLKNRTRLAMLALEGSIIAQEGLDLP